MTRYICKVTLNIVKQLQGWAQDGTVAKIADFNIFRMWPLAGGLIFLWGRIGSCSSSQLGQKKNPSGMHIRLSSDFRLFEHLFLANDSGQKLSWIKDTVNRKSAPILHTNRRLQSYTAFWVGICLPWASLPRTHQLWVSWSMGHTQY